MFGVEGFRVGQLRLPRGIVVDDNGCVVVADAGNARLQVFDANGAYVCGFGQFIIR